MIKSLLMPAILALVVSMAGSAGFTVMKARSMHAAYVIVQDSIALVHAADSAAHDSTAHDGAENHDSGATDGAHETDSLAHDAGVPSLEHATTPADSIRALIAEREAQRTASDAHDTKPPTSGKSGAEEHQTTSVDHAASTDTPADPPAKAPTPAPAAAPVRPAVEPAAEVLPERRLAKIFSAMSAKDAAKVLEQMSDGDIRVILSMMGDRQAAAVLTSLPSARAAAITKGANTAPGNPTP
jgi:hypothetical protein